MKKDPAVQLDLPEKYEATEYIPLSVEQSILYENYIQDMFTQIDQLSKMERRGLILKTLTKLKQLCNHPALVLKEISVEPWRDRSNKLERLLDIVRELREQGDKCLIFTQFVETGYLLQRVLEAEIGEKTLFLHGGTSKAMRDDMIARFQDESHLHSESHVLSELSEPNAILILSLKAGGVGLNLTAASHVFHFDRWWNPAVEKQATDRAYRWGQKRNVHVHTFVTIGTLEERIHEMLDRKQGLSEQIVGAHENWITELSTDDLKEVFKLRQEWV
jgi:SNF2 family DNA or RNA helicase